jgi:hypothetical protein
MASAATTAGMTRQACDRCRKHKLRCTRVDNAGACDRCSRKGAQCSYSSTLPKGRRSTNARNSSTGGDSQAGISDDLTNGFQHTGSRSSSMDWDGFQLDLAGEGNSTRTESSFDWLYGVNPAPCDNIAMSSTPFPGSQDRDLRLVNIASNSSSSGSGGLDGGDGKDDPEALIAQLAQLSTHISLLRRSGCVLVRYSDGQSQGRHPPLIDDTVFQSVATWLARGPNDIAPSCSPAASHSCWTQAPKIKTLGDLLYHIFSASHHLLELLRQVPGNSTPNTTTISRSEYTPQFLDFSVPSLNMDGSTPLGSESGQASTWKSPSSSPIASSNNVIRHLLIANHTMLLGIYSEVFGLLQRCLGPSTSECTTPLREIRLASVVQLCSYLIDRQHQAMDLYLSSPVGRLLGPETVPDTTTTEAMKAIRTEVGQRILGLQQMIPI